MKIGDGSLGVDVGDHGRRPERTLRAEDITSGRPAAEDGSTGGEDHGRAVGTGSLGGGRLREGDRQQGTALRPSEITARRPERRPGSRPDFFRCRPGTCARRWPSAMRVTASTAVVEPGS